MKSKKSVIVYFRMLKALNMYTIGLKKIKNNRNYSCKLNIISLYLLDKKVAFAV